MQKRFSSALEKNRFFVVFFRFENSQGLFLNAELRTQNFEYIFLCEITFHIDNFFIFVFSLNKGKINLKKI